MLFKNKTDPCFQEIGLKTYVRNSDHLHSNFFFLGPFHSIFFINNNQIWFKKPWDGVAFQTIEQNCVCTVNSS